MKKVIIIGGGASGMTAAISAARAGAKAILLEHADRAGKKILSTGNGKCNYANRKQGLRCYRGENPAFALPAFEQFGLKETLSFFRELGVYPKERDGYFYPASGQAASVRDVLLMELRRLKVPVQTDCEIASVIKKKDGFVVSSSQEDFFADCCIFACGGMAFPKSGSDGSAFPLIGRLGHTFTDLSPALVQMKAKQSFFKQIAGIRADSSIQLDIGGKTYQDRGEIQLTKDGVSGIPSFQVSRYAAKALKKRQSVRAFLDFAPFLSKEELYRELYGRFRADSGKSCEEALCGLLAKKLIPVFLKESGISPQEAAVRVKDGSVRRLSSYLKRVGIDITGTAGFEAAQATAGGVNTEEIFAHSMESRLVPGLYFAGEVIDVDGMCGGYNLQWAWSSGYLAGAHAAREGDA